MRRSDLKERLARHGVDPVEPQIAEGIEEEVRDVERFSVDVDRESSTEPEGGGTAELSLDKDGV